MAPKTSVSGPLTQEGVEDLVSKSAVGRALAAVLLPLSDSGDSGSVDALCVAHLVYVRAGGFLLVVPLEEEVHGVLESLEGEEFEEVQAAFQSGSVEVEGVRGNTLGIAEVELVDFPWSAVSNFFPGTALRQNRFKESGRVQLQVGGQSGRPAKSSVFELADRWISSATGPPTAQEYLTAEEGPPEAEGDLDGEPLSPGDERRAFLSRKGAVPGQELRALQERITLLEGELQRRAVAPAAAPLGPASSCSVKTPPLFGTQQGQLSPADWSRLQQLAGAPPPRAAGVEQRRKALAPLVEEQDGFLAELEKEAEDVVTAEMGLETAGDPNSQMAKIMMAQFQQNSLLLRKLVGPKHPDPITGLLSGASDSASGSGGGSGVKGCLARDAYVRASQDLTLVANTVRKNALQELGYPPSKEDGNLLRKCLERRMPVAEHRTLAYVGTLVAEGWSTAYESQNLEMMGVLAKIMIFLEQASIDGGKLQLAWLLTGHQEPPWQILLNSKKKPGLQPFSRLAAPSWISANLAYLKDLDFMETRMSSLTRQSPPERPERDLESKPKPKPKPKKGFGKGKKSDQSPEGDTEN